MTAARIEQEISRPYVIRAQTRKPVGDGNEVLHNRIVTAHAGSYEQAAEQVGQQVALGGEHVAKLLTPKSIFEGDLGSLYPDGGRHTRLGGSAILSAVADLLDAYDAKDADRIRVAMSNLKADYEDAEEDARSETGQMLTRLADDLEDSGRLEFPVAPILSMGDDSGAYVLAWAWVDSPDDEAARLTPQPE